MIWHITENINIYRKMKVSPTGQDSGLPNETFPRPRVSLAFSGILIKWIL